MADDMSVRRHGRLARLMPWLLLWVAAPAPLWLALGMTFWMRLRP